jgi:hypothetical protein
MNGRSPPRRSRARALDLVAHAVGAPCLAAAFLLYFVVTWTPQASPRREILCGALLLAGIGASLIESRSTPRLRPAGIVAMTVGLVASFATVIQPTGDPP